MPRQHELDRALRRAELAEARLEEQKATMEAVRARIERMYEPHTHPYADGNLRLGNGLPSRWWCAECRRPWPCADFTEYRALYSITYYGGDPEPKDPVELTFVPTNKVKL